MSVLVADVSTLHFPVGLTWQVESLTAQDLSSYVSKALKSSPTFVTYGSLTARVPRYDTILKRFA
jgi:hypothetical protein